MGGMGIMGGLGGLGGMGIMGGLGVMGSLGIMGESTIGQQKIKATFSVAFIGNYGMI